VKADRNDLPELRLASHFSTSARCSQAIAQLRRTKRGVRISIIVADEAVRDEGTSLHYLEASASVSTPTHSLVPHLMRELATVGDVRHGLVWTTDAPYRETEDQLSRWTHAGALAVEMQAASLFAFGHATGANLGLVALVSNSPAQSQDQFDTGGHDYRLRVLTAVANAARAFLDDLNR
jgi:uridine phosphorylase